MVGTETLESLNELITAIGKHLGDKYTVRHLPVEDKKNEYHNIAVIDNDIRVAAFIKAPRPLVIKTGDGISSLAEWLSDEALKSISITAKGNPENLLFHG